MSEIPDRIRAWRALMLVHARVTAALDERLRAEVGIPLSWYEAIVEIAFAGGTMQMHQFAEETTLTKSGATRFVDRLEQAGLVSRASCPTDRRVSYLALTDKGRDLQRTADPIVLQTIHETFGIHLSDSDAKILRKALDRTLADTVAA